MYRFSCDLFDCLVSVSRTVLLVFYLFVCYVSVSRTRFPVLSLIVCYVSVSPTVLPVISLIVCYVRILSALFDYLLLLRPAHCFSCVLFRLALWFLFFFRANVSHAFFFVFCLIVKFLVRNCFGFSLFCLIINSIPPILSIVVFSLIVTSVALCVAVCFVQLIHVFLSCVYISKSPYFTRFSSNNFTFFFRFGRRVPFCVFMIIGGVACLLVLIVPKGMLLTYWLNLISSSQRHSILDLFLLDTFEVALLLVKAISRHVTIP